MIKYLLTFSILSSIGLCQDVLILKNGIPYEGEWIKNEDGGVHFKPKVDMNKPKQEKKEKKKVEPNKGVQKIPKATVAKIKLSNGVTITPDDTGSRDELLEKQLKENCEKNSSIKVMVMQIKDDFYGLTDEVMTDLGTACYIVENNYSGFEYLEKNKIDNEDINDYHLLSIGKANNLDFIFFGYSYRIEEPFKYVADPSQLNPYNPREFLTNDNDWGAVLTNAVVAFNRKAIQNYENERRMQYELESGNYVYGTLYSIEISTGIKSYWFKNERLLKF